MSPIVDLLHRIRERPAVYIGGNSLTKLAMFLRGYQHAAEQFGMTTNDQFLREFGEWVRGRFNVSICRGWDEVIRFYSGSDEEAIRSFWTLLDEYLRGKPTGGSGTPDS